MELEVPSQDAMRVAARLWCTPRTEHLTMTAELAIEIAKKVERYHTIIEVAWNLIANAGNGSWENEKQEWQKAAINWRDNYWHKMLEDDIVDNNLSEETHAN